jgi:hypothetical protein
MTMSAPIYQGGAVIFTISQDPGDCRCASCGAREVISRRRPAPPGGDSQGDLDEFGDEPFEAPPGKPPKVASYIGGDMPTAYVESGGGDPLPSSPIFLSETRYIPAPLEATYMRAWAAFPALLKEIIDPMTG